MTRIFKLLAVAMLAFGLVSAAHAGPLDAEKAQGLVGEQANGYLGVVGSVSADVKRQVDEINLKRRERYREIAKKNGTSLAAVEAIVGEKLIGRAKAGEFVMGADGKWRKK